MNSMKHSEYQLLVVSPHPPNALLRDTFTHVNYVESAKEALNLLKQQQQQQQQHLQTIPPTLLLIDMDNEQQNIVSLKLLIYHLRQGTVGHFIPLVCCSNDSSDYMLDCIHHGAADYLLKPLSQNVIQTMFLAAHRYSPPPRLLPSPTSSSSTASLKTNLPSITKSGQEFHQYHQLTEILNHHDWIYQAIIDLYSNSKRPKKVFDLDGLPIDRKLELEKRLGEWDFSPFDLSDTDLVYCVSWIFDQALLLPDLAPYRLSSVDFIADLWNGYHTTNPYHTFYHAVDVLQSMYYVLYRTGLLKQSSSDHIPNCINQLITPIDIFVLFLICIGHDLGHPGVTNSFMINTSTSLSLLFNDISVLESYHAMLFYRLIKNYWSDSLGKQLEAVFRKRVVKGILATDMALHQEYMTKLTHLKQSTDQYDGDNDDDKEEERTLVYAALIKCADISNIARPFSVAKTWANRLVEELQCQDLLEAELGLKSCLNSFGLPLDLKGKLPLAAFQYQFITKVGIGLFDIVGDFIPDIKEWAKMARQNALAWQQFDTSM